MRVSQRSDQAPWALMAGGAVLFGSLFLRWFTATLSDQQIPGHRTAWQWFGGWDLYLAAVALLAFVVAFLAAGNAPALDIAVRAMAAASAVGFVVVAYWIVSPPDDAAPGFVTIVSVSAGPWVALAALAVLGLAAATLGALSPRSG